MHKCLEGAMMCVTFIDCLFSLSIFSHFLFFTACSNYGFSSLKDVVRQFEGHVRTYEQLTAKIAEREEQAVSLVQDMETRENQWKQELNDLVDAISSNFSRYFKEMKCAGEVLLFTGNSEVSCIVLLKL